VERTTTNGSSWNRFRNLGSLRNIFVLVQNHQVEFALHINSITTCSVSWHVISSFLFLPFICAPIVQQCCCIDCTIDCDGCRETGLCKHLFARVLNSTTSPWMMKALTRVIEQTLVCKRNWMCDRANTLLQAELDAGKNSITSRKVRASWLFCIMLFLFISLLSPILCTYILTQLCFSCSFFRPQLYLSNILQSCEQTALPSVH
jgi:hypothetical protein